MEVPKKAKTNVDKKNLIVRFFSVDKNIKRVIQPRDIAIRSFFFQTPKSKLNEVYNLCLIARYTNDPS